MPSPARKDGLNAMKCTVSTFISPTWSAAPERGTGERGGEHRGGTGLCARCSPFVCAPGVPSIGSWSPSEGRGAAAKALSLRPLRRTRTGGVLCRPPAAGSQPPRSVRQPWRERPRFSPHLSPGPAASAGRSRHGCRRHRRASSPARSMGGHHCGSAAASCRNSAALSAVEPAGGTSACAPLRRKPCRSLSPAPVASSWSVAS